MSNFFVSRRLYTLNDQFNYIMNCSSKDHKAIKETIEARGKAETDQTLMPVVEMLKDHDQNLLLLPNVSPGKVIRDILEGNV